MAHHGPPDWHLSNHLAATSKEADKPLIAEHAALALAAQHTRPTYQLGHHTLISL